MATTLLEMRGITKRFPGVKALDGFSFDLRAGEVHALCGENGAGKSTLIKVLYGVYQPDEGEILIDGQQTVVRNVQKAVSLGIGVVFQELNVCMHLDIANNVFLGRAPNRYSIIDDHKMVDATRTILHDTIKMDVSPRRLVRTLSLAERQMVEIAKVVSRKSRIIVFDEPTSSLTEKETKHLFEIIRRLKEEGVGVIYISHRLEELSQIADRVTVMRDGQHIKTLDYCDVTNEQLVALMVGRTMKEQYPVYRRKIGKVIFSADDIHYKMGRHIDRIEVRQGEIVGLSGLVGSGRTESMRVLFGADKGSVGLITIGGKRFRKFRSQKEAIEHGFLYMTEDRKKEGLLHNLNVEENINISSLRKISRHRVVSQKLANMNALRYITELAIKTPGLFQRVQFLSGGNQQKLILAKWMSCDMKVLVFDEPTRGIDVGAKYEIYRLMNELSDKGVAIIMISSDLSEIIGMSDRVYVYNNGSIRGELIGAEIEPEKIMAYATGIK